MSIEFGVHRRSGKGRGADRNERAFHATVRMSVDNAGNNDLRRSIDDIVVVRTGALPDVNDATVPNLDIAAGNDAGAVSRHNRSARDQHRLTLHWFAFAAIAKTA